MEVDRKLFLTVARTVRKEISEGNVALCVDASKGVSLTAVDPEFWLTVTLPPVGEGRKSETAQGAVIPVKRLEGCLGSETKENLVRVGVDNTCLVKIGDRATFVGRPIEDFPCLDDPQGDLVGELDVAEFQEALREVIFVADNKQERRFLQGGFLEFSAERGGIFLVGSDAKRLAFRKLKGEIYGDFAFTVPWSALRILKSIPLGGEKVKIFVTKREEGEGKKARLVPDKAYFVWNGGVLRAWLIDTLCDPDYWRKVIPSYTEARVWRVGKLDLAEALRKVKASVSGERDLAVKFVFTDGKLEISAESRDGESSARAEIETSYTKNGESEIRKDFLLNAGFVLEYLATLPKEVLTVDVKYSDDRDPVGWFRPEAESPDYIVMPISR